MFLLRRPIAHIELAREVARRFNNLYGKDEDFKIKALSALEKIGSKNRNFISPGQKNIKKQVTKMLGFGSIAYRKFNQYKFQRQI